MANYYPLIAGIIGALETNFAERRRRLYENARTAFLNQMLKHDPPLSEASVK